MPLTWDLTACKADVDLTGDKNEWSITYVVIMSTMGVGIGHITEKNADEFYARMKFMEALDGPLLNNTTHEEDKPDRIEPRPIAPIDIKRRIGVRTNVADETRASFIRRHLKWKFNEYVRQYRDADEDSGA